jgi:hypothetical protein
MKKYLLLVAAFFLTTAIFAQKSDSLHYGIIIKFGSMAAGVPSNQPVLAYVAAFKKKYKIKKITYDRIGPMGREGEYYMAFPLKELSKKQKAEFVKNLHQIAKKLTDRGYASTEENESVSKSEFEGKITHITL